MGRDLAQGIVAPVLALKVYAGYARLLDLTRQLRCHVALQIHELPPAPFRQQALQLSQVETEQPRQLGPAAGLVCQLTGICPHRVHRCADSQRLTVTIENSAPVSRNRLHPQMASVALADQKILVRVLQIHRAPQEPAGDDQQKHHHQPAPAGKTRLTIALHTHLLMG